MDKGGPGYEDTLAITWDSGAAVGEEALHRVNVAAVRALKALAALEDGPRDSLDESTALHQEINRIEGKLDLMLALVGQLARGSADLPERRRVFIRAEGLSWLDAPAEPAPAIGDHGLASLYLYPGLPVPVTVPAVIERGGDGLPALRFQGLVAETRNVLQRHVFRHHRRAVARARKASQRGP